MCSLSFSVLPLSHLLSPCLPSSSSHLLTSSRLVLTACGVLANHLSPQALKWREYRRRNPLGLDRVSGLPGLASSLDRRQQEPRLNRGNPIFELPGSLNTSHFHCKLNGAHHLSAGGTLGSDLGAQVQYPLGLRFSIPWDSGSAWPHHCFVYSEQEGRCICSQCGQGAQEEGENCLTDGYPLCGTSLLLHKLRAVRYSSGLY